RPLFRRPTHTLGHRTVVIDIFHPHSFASPATPQKMGFMKRLRFRNRPSVGLRAIVVFLNHRTVPPAFYRLSARPDPQLPGCAGGAGRILCGSNGHPVSTSGYTVAHPRFHVLYANTDELMNELFHDLVVTAIGEQFQVQPFYAHHEYDIRQLWPQHDFQCAFLVINNIITIAPDAKSPAEHMRRVLAMLPWLREQSPSTIIALTVWEPAKWKRQAIISGADFFVPIPFNVDEMVRRLKERFL
ncbi:MAG: response regulator, partial [Phycisphaerales bacterium]